MKIFITLIVLVLIGLGVGYFFGYDHGFGEAVDLDQANGSEQESVSDRTDVQAEPVTYSITDLPDEWKKIESSEGWSLSYPPELDAKGVNSGGEFRQVYLFSRGVELREGNAVVFITIGPLRDRTIRQRLLDNAVKEHDISEVVIGNNTYVRSFTPVGIYPAVFYTTAFGEAEAIVFTIDSPTAEPTEFELSANFQRILESLEI